MAAAPGGTGPPIHTQWPSARLTLMGQNNRLVSAFR